MVEKEARDNSMHNLYIKWTHKHSMHYEILSVRIGVGGSELVYKVVQSSK